MGAMCSHWLCIPPLGVDDIHMGRCWAQRHIRNVRVDGIIDGGHKCRKIDVKYVVVANEATPCHGSMGAEGVQRDPKGWNVKNIPNTNDMSVK